MCDIKAEFLKEVTATNFQYLKYYNYNIYNYITYNYIKNPMQKEFNAAYMFTFIFPLK